MKIPTQFNPIGWCHFTVNFWWGCAKVSPGCAHCYAATWNNLRGQGRAQWGLDGKRWVRTAAAMAELKKHDARARKLGVRWRIFINSMADTFEDRPELAEARTAIFALAPTLTNLDLLLLTKRPENVCRLIPAGSLPGDGPYYQRPGWPANVWLGFTAENQRELDKRWEQMRVLNLIFNLPVIFISAEPLLERLMLPHFTADQRRKLWVIAGGESGPRARPCDLRWMIDLRDQCHDGGDVRIPFYFKQWGSRPVETVRKADNLGVETLPCNLVKNRKGADPLEWPASLRVREFPNPGMPPDPKAEVAA